MPYNTKTKVYQKTFIQPILRLLLTLSKTLLSYPSPCSSHWTNWLLLAANQSKSNLLIQYLSRLILLTAYECALVGNHLKSSIPSALIREQARLPRFLPLLLMLLLPPPLLLRYVPGRNVFWLSILPETALRPCQLLSLAALMPEALVG